MKTSVLLIGESWHTHIVEAKGADTFSYDTYQVATEHLEAVLNTDEIELSHMPCHLVAYDFPQSAEELKEKYDCVLISDCGANTFLLPEKTFLQYVPTPNKLEILRDYVKLGGGLCMVGGYLSFMGLEGKGRYNATPVEEALPVNFLTYDDRVELPQGVNFDVEPGMHAILAGLETVLPTVFGYNRAVLKEEAEAIMTYKGDPIISLMNYGKGRSIAYAMDCAPHWCSPDFCASSAYKTLWRNVVKWLAKAL